MSCKEEEEEVEVGEVKVMKSPAFCLLLFFFFFFLTTLYSLLYIYSFLFTTLHLLYCSTLQPNYHSPM